MDQNDNHITVYSDYVCPFCSLGRRSLEEYQETRERELAIDWRPFDLRSRKRGPDGEIDHSVDDGKDDAYFDQVRRNVARLKDKYSADEMFSLDALPEEIDSFDAQVAFGKTGGSRQQRRNLPHTLAGVSNWWLRDSGHSIE